MHPTNVAKSTNHKSGSDVEDDAANAAFMKESVAPTDQSLPAETARPPGVCEDNDDAGRTVACRLDVTTVRNNNKTLSKLQALARTMHDVRRDAHELITHHVHRVLKANEESPDLTEQSTVYRFFVAVTNSDNEGKRPELDQAIAATRAACMPALVRHAVPIGFARAMDLDCVKYCASVKTQIHRSFRKRVGRVVALRLRLDDATLATLSTEEKKAHRWATKRAMEAATSPSGSKKLSGVHATVVDAVIADLKLGDIDLTYGKGAPKSMAYVLKAAPCRFLPALRLINIELEAAGAARFRLVPMTTNNVPGFTTIDQQLLKNMGFVSKEAKAKINKRMVKRCADVAPYTAELKRLRSVIRAHEAEWKEADFQLNRQRYLNFLPEWEAKETLRLGALEAELEQRDADDRAAVGKKRTRVSKKSTALKRRAVPKKPVLTDEHAADDARESCVRDTVLAPTRAAIAAIETDPAYQKLVDAAANEKRDTFEAVFDIRKAVRRPDRWAHSLSTDGFSMRLLMKRPQRTPKTNRDNQLTAMPQRGIFTVEQLVAVTTEGVRLPDDELERILRLSPIEQNLALQAALDKAHGGVCPFFVMGVDPGKRELIVATNPNAAPANRAARLASPPTTVRYTAAQRAFDIAPGKYILSHKGRKDPVRVARAAKAQQYRRSTRPDDAAALQAAVASMARHASSAATGAGFKDYTDARRAALPLLNAVYADDMLHRRLRWKAFVDKQKSLQALVNRLAKVERAHGKQLVLSYGAWGMQAGVAGSPVNKGLPPAIGVGLLRHLARFFVVVVVPEHFTSKTCYHCGCHECGNHPTIAEQHRPRRDAKALVRRDKRLAQLEQQGGNEVLEAKAHKFYTRTIARVPEVRGLRLCPKCKRCLNRDNNAANNIGLQFKRLLLGLGPIKALDKDEIQLHKATVTLDGGDL